jgi:hypothetical protein
MIISASRRTDIPCLFGEWFINRLRAGWVLVRNPMNHAMLSRIPLSPDIVDCIVFWTKDAANIIPRLQTIEDMGYKYYFQFTLTPYGSDIEKNLRGKADIEDTFIELSGRIGKERVLWRYDPVVLNDRIDAAYHKERFLRMCEKLYKHTESITISFADIYPKLKTGLLREITDEEIDRLGSFFGRTAKSYGLRAFACCEKTDLTVYGIEKSACINKALIEKICGCPLDLAPDKNQRSGCGCCESIDIGAYNTCPNGCVYCYANSGTAAERRYKSHDPAGELLCGVVGEGEKITERKVRSNRQEQMKLL